MNKENHNIDEQVPSKTVHNQNGSTPNHHQFGHGLHKGLKNADDQIKERLNTNRNRMFFSPNPKEKSETKDSQLEERQKEQPESEKKEVEVKEEQEKDSLFAKLLIFFGLPPTLVRSPLLKYGFIIVMILFFLLFILIIVISSQRVQNGRKSIISYLESGSIEEEGADPSVVEEIRNKFYNSDLYQHLQAEGWCKGSQDCYNSNAANFYKTFRKRIQLLQIAGTSINKENGCSNHGFIEEIELDIPMLLATFTYYRSDDEYLRADPDENYNDKMKIFTKEINELTEAMVVTAENIVTEINVTEASTKKVKVTSETNCTQYGLEWITVPTNQNGGYCIQKEGKELPEYVKIKETLEKCIYVSEDNYKDYVMGDGAYYSTPGTYTPSGGTTSGNQSQSVLEYIDSISEWATNDMGQSGIYASVTIAQAILESGRGKSGLSVNYNNHFGMKGIGGACSNNQSGKTKKDEWDSPTWDGTSVCMCGGDGCYWYRAYRDIGESLADHSRNFWRTKSYGRNGVLECVQNNLGPEEQISRIKAAGYATDSQYVDKIINIIDTYDLKQYDTATYTGDSPEYNSGNPSNDHAPNRYTSGGYLELYRMSLLENASDINRAKEKIYERIINEAKETGSLFNKTDDIEIIDPTGGDYINWRQTDPAWKNIPIGPSTIGDIGCAATSVAIQIARSGTQVNIDEFNPGNFVKQMTRVGGFNEKGSIIWRKVSDVAPYFVYERAFSMNGYSLSRKIETIQTFINEGCYLIMSVKNNGHWVAVTGVTSNNIKIIDPSFAIQEALPTYSASGIDQLRCYKKLD